MAPELSIAIPFYNEENNVKSVITNLTNELESKNIDYEIVPVNNGSWDKTPEILEELAKDNKRIKIVTIVKNQGYGHGITTGLKNCTGRYIGYIWGDEQTSASEVTKVLEKIKKGDLDLGKTERRDRYDGPFRIFQSRVYNVVMSTLFMHKIWDTNGCPKIMKKEVFYDLNIQSDDWFLDPELVIKTYQKGYKVGNVRATFNKRKSGKTNVNLATAIEFIIHIIKFRLTGKP